MKKMGNMSGRDRNVRNTGTPQGSQRDTTSNSTDSVNSIKLNDIESQMVKGRDKLTANHAGIHRKKENNNYPSSELSMSRHGRNEGELEVLTEVAAHLEKSNSNMSGLFPPEELRDIPYDKSQTPSPYRSEEFTMQSNSGEFVAPRIHNAMASSMSVVSDMSLDRPPSLHSMPMLSLAQDSGSILPHLNTSHKSACSFTPGSRRLQQKKKNLLSKGSIVYCEKVSAQKRKEDKELAFDRWGGRKDYSSNPNLLKKRKKKGISKVQKAKLKAQAQAELKRKLEAQDSMRSTDSMRPSMTNLWGLAFKQDHLRYEELIREDKDRELVASYCEQPFYKIIFHFKGTVLRVIIEDILFWLTLATYVAIRINFRLDVESESLFNNLDSLANNLAYVGASLTFFLVFYVNQNHHRYFELHKDSMVLMGRVNDVATLVKALLPMERARRINRYMNAAHVAMYTGLSSTYEQDNFFDPLEARFALLTDEELYRIREEIDVDTSGPKAAFEIITWVMCDIRDAQINNFIDTNEANQLREQLLQFRSTIAKIFVRTTLPIPFFYVHFLSMLTAVYLPLFAIVVASETGFIESGNRISNVWVAEVVSGLVVFLQALFVIGLRILGQQLSDPYGGDLIDLQIARYVNMILNGSNQILAAKRLHPPSVETELRLQLKMSSLGNAFEYDTDDEVVVQQ